MWIRNVRIFNEKHVFVPGALRTAGERIREVISFFSPEEAEAFMPPAGRERRSWTDREVF